MPEEEREIFSANVLSVVFTVRSILLNLMFRFKKTKKQQLWITPKTNLPELLCSKNTVSRSKNVKPTNKWLQLILVFNHDFSAKCHVLTKLIEYSLPQPNVGVLIQRDQAKMDLRVYQWKDLVCSQLFLNCGLRMMTEWIFLKRSPQSSLAEKLQFPKINFSLGHVWMFYLLVINPVSTRHSAGTGVWLWGHIWCFQLTGDSCATPTHAWVSPGGSLLFPGSSPAVGSAAELDSRGHSHSGDLQSWRKRKQEMSQDYLEHLHCVPRWHSDSFKHWVRSRNRLVPLF